MYPFSVQPFTIIAFFIQVPDQLCFESPLSAFFRSVTTRINAMATGCTAAVTDSGPWANEFGTFYALAQNNDHVMLDVHSSHVYELDSFFSKPELLATGFIVRDKRCCAPS